MFTLDIQGSSRFSLTVMASTKDPLPGWVDNLNGPMAMYAAAQKGILQVLPFNNTALDTIPVDSATKIILLASWLKGIAKSIRYSYKPVAKQKKGISRLIPNPEIDFLTNSVSLCVDASFELF